MKKLLALVLALVMSMSLVTISNAAFKDADKIDYKEAVDVMNAIGVFVGDENGNFNAKENLTREQAAKIIAYLELGDKTADALAGSNIFTDVASTRWSAGFIGYCAQAGVVNGVGDSKFDPTGALTALQFGKMLLVELGYDAKAAKMVGTDWAIATSKLMATAKLMDSIDGSVNQVLTREKAAQMALNALKAPTVEYETKGSSISVNGAEIDFGASTPKYVTSEIAAARNISREQLSNQNGYTVELGEKLYPKLVLTGESDEFQCYANDWTYKGKGIGTYTQEADEHYTEKKTSGDIYADLGLTKATTVTEYYIDGVQQAAILLEKGNTVAANKVGGQGADTYVYLNSDGSVRICVVNTYVADVTAVYAATATKDAYITLGMREANTSAYDSIAANFSTKNTFKTTEFAVDDIVLFNYSNKSGDVGVYNVVKAQTAEGELTNYKTDTQATIGGTVYKYNAKIAMQASDTYLNKSVKATVILDKYGNAIDLTDNGVVNYAVVLKVSGNAGDFNASSKANLLLADGAVVEAVSLTNVAGATANTSVANAGVAANSSTDITENDIVSYTINNKGKYTLTRLATETATNVDITNGNSLLTNMSGGTTVANGKTLFLVATGTSADTKYTAYEGIKNVPSIKYSGGSVTNTVYAKTTGVATLVYIDARTNALVNTEEVIFVKGNSAPKKTVDVVYGEYYTYDAIVDGEITKLNTVHGNISSNTMYNTVAYTTYSDGTKVATLANTQTTYANGDTTGVKFATGIEKQANGTLSIAWDGTIYTGAIVPSDDCKVFYVNSDNDIVASTVSAIAADKDDVVYFKLSNGLATTIVINALPKNDGTVITPTTTSYYSVGAIAAAGSKNVQVVIYKADKDGNRISGALSKAELKALGIKDSDVTVTTAGDVRSLKCGADEEGHYYLTASATTPSTWNFSDSAIAYFDGFQFDGSTAGFTAAYGSTAGFMKIHLDNVLFPGALTVSIKTVNGNVFFADNTTLS